MTQPTTRYKRSSIDVTEAMHDSEWVSSDDAALLEQQVEQLVGDNFSLLQQLHAVEAKLTEKFTVRCDSCGKDTTIEIADERTREGGFKHRAEQAQLEAGRWQLATEQAEARVRELEAWPHCEECNFPLQDQGTPNGLVCLLCDEKEKRTAASNFIKELEKTIEHWTNRSHIK